MKEKIQTYLILMFCVMAWGSSYVVIKIGLESFEAAQVATYRLVVAGLISLIFITRQKIRLISPRQFIRILIISFFGIFVYHIMITYFTVYFEPNVISFAANAAPIFMLIFSNLILNESLEKIRWSGFWLAMFGIGMMNYEPGTNPDWKQLGLLILPITGALFFVLQKPLLKEMKSEHLINWCILIGAMMLLIYDASFISEIWVASLQSNLAVIYLGIIPTVIAFHLWAQLLSKTKASNLASPIYLVPIFTIFWSFIVLDHLPEWQTIVGGSITIIGVVVSKRKLAETK